MTLQELREKRAQLVSDMEATIKAAEDDGRMDLDDEEAELYSSYEQELQSVDRAIERKNTVEGHKAKLNEPETSILHSQGADRSVPGPESKQEFETFGEFVGALTRHYTGKGDDPRLQWQEPTPSAQGQEMDDGSSGGFLVPNQFRDQLLKVDPQEAVIEGRSNVMMAGSPPDAAITMPALDQTGSSPDNVYGGVSVDWIAEGAEKPETEASFREISLEPHEIAAHVAMTDKLMRNAPAASQQIEQLMRGALMSARERAYLQGDGVGKPLGMINAGATYKVNRSTANQVSYEDLSTMCGRLHMSGGQPYWLISQSAYSEIKEIQDPNGSYVWQPNAREGAPSVLFGYPVFWYQRSPQLGNLGDVVLCNTDPFYLIKPGSGPIVSMGYINKDFVENKTRVKVCYNVDGKPWLTEPFTQESGYQVSPFVALDTP